MRKTYIITDQCSGDSFEMEMTTEQYMAVKYLEGMLGYVMEDVWIREKGEDD